jgi:hypothetical protein
MKTKSNKKFEKLVQKVWQANLNNIYSNDLTYLRKNLTLHNFSYFQKFLKEGEKDSFNSPRTQLVWRVLSLAPKYFVAGDSLTNFKEVLAQEAAKPINAPLNKSIQIMAPQLIMSDMIAPEEKIFLFDRSQQSVNTDFISLELIEYGIKHFQANRHNLLGQPNSYGVYQLVYQALKRKQFKALPELTLFLTEIVKTHNTINNHDEFHEHFIKEIKTSPHLNLFSNDLFKEVLTGWQNLINTTQIRFDYNHHHQTKKRLMRLKDEYLVMRDLFRNILNQRTDPQSQLDALLMG